MNNNKIFGICVSGVLALSNITAANATDTTSLSTNNNSKIEKCVNCHGADGVSMNPLIPNLAGQKKTYLMTQLNHFSQQVTLVPGKDKLNVRFSSLMNHEVKALNAEETEMLADFYSKKRCKSPGTGVSVTPPAVITTCAICHGENGRSKLKAVPHLAGQNVAYLVKQLELFRSTSIKYLAKGQNINSIKKQNTEYRFHKAMYDYARPYLLRDTEIVKLAEYYSSFSCSGDETKNAALEVNARKTKVENRTDSQHNKAVVSLDNHPTDKNFLDDFLIDIETASEKPGK